MAKLINAAEARKITEGYKDPKHFKWLLVRIRYAAELGYSNSVFFLPYSRFDEAIQWTKELKRLGFKADWEKTFNAGRVTGAFIEVAW